MRKSRSFLIPYRCNIDMTVVPPVFDDFKKKIFLTGLQVSFFVAESNGFDIFSKIYSISELERCILAVFSSRETS